MRSNRNRKLIDRLDELICYTTYIDQSDWNRFNFPVTGQRFFILDACIFSMVYEYFNWMPPLPLLHANFSAQHALACPRCVMKRIFLR